MKHLKLRGKWLPLTKEVEVSLVYRTHVGYEFGTYTEFLAGFDDPTWAFKHGDIIIASDGCSVNFKRMPVYKTAEDEADPWVLCIPDHMKTVEAVPTDDYLYCRVSLDDWDRIKEAVKAYNEYFKGD